QSDRAERRNGHARDPRADLGHGDAGGELPSRRVGGGRSRFRGAAGAVGRGRRVTPSPPPTRARASARLGRHAITSHPVPTSRTGCATSSAGPTPPEAEAIDRVRDRGGRPAGGCSNDIAGVGGGKRWAVSGKR